MDINTTIYTIATWIIPALLAITLHEVAHGWVAYKLGDPTAKMLGRLTVNPIKHIDPIGTIVVPLALVVLSTGFVFGWAKPIPVNTRNLKSLKRDMALVAIAGPAANFIMALLWVIFLFAVPYLFSSQSMVQGVSQMAQNGVLLNIVLLAFNLLPIPPLDGSKVLSGFLSPRLGDYMNRIEPYGLIIVVVLLVSGLLQDILQPMIFFFMKIISSILSIFL